MSLPMNSILSLTSATPDSCDGCFVGAAYNISTPGLSSDPDSGTQVQPYIVYDAYSVTSFIFSDGVCTTENGRSISLTSPFKFGPVPTSVNATSLLPTANERFVDFLGFSSCSSKSNTILSKSADTTTPVLIQSGGTVSSLPVPLVPVDSGFATVSYGTLTTALTTVIVTSATPTDPASAVPTSTSSAVTNSSGGLNRAARIAIGVITPIISIALIAAAALILKGYRNNKQQAMLVERDGDNGTETANQSSPYLQNKAELEDEQRRKYELEANGVKYEIGPEGAIHEAPTGEGSLGNSIAQNQQELHGEDFSKELNTTNDPNNVGRER